MVAVEVISSSRVVVAPPTVSHMLLVCRYIAVCSLAALADSVAAPVADLDVDRGNPEIRLTRRSKVGFPRPWQDEYQSRGLYTSGIELTLHFFDL